MAAAFFALELGADSAAIRPPNTTYTYQFVRGGAPFGISTIVVTSSNALVHVNEKATIGSVAADVHFDLDETSLAQSGYAGSFVVQGQQTDVKITHDATDILTIRVGADAVAVHALASAPTLLVADDLVSAFAFIPAIAKQRHLGAITEVVPNGSRALRADVAFGERPGTLSMIVNGLHLDFTFDPKTFVVSNVHVNEQNFDIQLVTPLT